MHLLGVLRDLVLPPRVVREKVIRDAPSTGPVVVPTVALLADVMMRLLNVEYGPTQSESVVQSFWSDHPTGQGQQQMQRKGMVVQSSLVIEAKTCQYNDPKLARLRDRVENGVVKSFSIDGEDVLRPRGRLCIPMVGHMKQLIREEAHSS
ncbi:hypothetical protein MTR67_012094 [Solanum verrucosum]|uniref:Uncharacterized protein n=1 Tax=Solanum verrucosum TaxID=315347 RepID=A0AAF0QF39_SOLVR|nr:hypothetical protein MTR67_012094 [Solanum verrucosum]